MIKAVWTDANVRGYLRAENAKGEGQFAEVRLKVTPDGFQVQIRYYAGGNMLERWTRTYKSRAHADNAVRTVKDRAERWFNGMRLKNLRPEGWEREREQPRED